MTHIPGDARPDFDGPIMLPLLLVIILWMIEKWSGAVYVGRAAFRKLTRRLFFFSFHIRWEIIQILNEHVRLRLTHLHKQWAIAICQFWLSADKSTEQDCTNEDLARELDENAPKDLAAGRKRRLSFVELVKTIQQLWFRFKLGSVKQLRCSDLLTIVTLTLREFAWTDFNQLASSPQQWLLRLMGTVVFWARQTYQLDEWKTKKFSNCWNVSIFLLTFFLFIGIVPNNQASVRCYSKFTIGKILLRPERYQLFRWHPRWMFE